MTKEKTMADATINIVVVIRKGKKTNRLFSCLFLLAIQINFTFICQQPVTTQSFTPAATTTFRRHVVTLNDDNNASSTCCSVDRHKEQRLLTRSTKIFLSLERKPTLTTATTTTTNLTKNKKHKTKKNPRKSNSSRRCTTTTPKEKTIVIVYHKPLNVVTSHAPDEHGGRPTVYDALTQQNYQKLNSIDDEHNSNIITRQLTRVKRKISAIGRLDAATTGLLLLTNDGGLIHAITNPTAAATTTIIPPHPSSSSSPPHHQNRPTKIVTKVYIAKIMGYHTPSSPTIDKIRHGVDIGTKYGGLTRPVTQLDILHHPTPTTTTVRIGINEGKNRQIRRMFHAVGSGVMALHRESVGGVTLEGVEREGMWRVMSDEEVWEKLGWKCRFLESDDDDDDDDGKSTKVRRRSNNRKRHHRRRS